jgi:hypothetical protein
VLEKGSIYVDGPLPPAPGPGQVSAAQPASAGPATEGAP